MQFDKTVARAKGILTTPKTEWPAAAAEPATVGGLYTGYIAIIAALPAIAHFLRYSLIGTGAFGVHYRVGIAAGLTQMVLGYLISLGVAYLVAVVVNALAPGFGGQKDMVQALKTVAYAWTAYWIAGIATLIPWLGFLVILAGGIYSIYLLYLGLPHTMKCPPERAGGYTAVSVIIAIVLSWILGLIVAGTIGASMFGAGMAGLHVSSEDSDHVTVEPDSALGRLAAMGERAEQASKDMEAARKSGDQEAQQAAMNRMMGAAMGNDGSVEALPADRVRQFLPDSVLGMKRTSTSAERSNAMGMQVTEARAQYGGDNGHDLTLEVTDLGSAKSMVGLAGMFAGEHEEETDSGYDKTYTDHGRMIHETWDKGGHGEYTVVVGQRFTVKAEGNVEDVDALKKAVASVDLDALEALKDEGVHK